MWWYLQTINNESACDDSSDNSSGKISNDVDEKVNLTIIFTLLEQTGARARTDDELQTVQ